MTKVNLTTLSELGLRRLDLKDITISESCSKSPSVLLSQCGELVARLEYDDLKATIDFLQSVLNYEDTNDD